MLKFLRSRGAKLDHGVVYMAAQVGRIDMLQWLIDEEHLPVDQCAYSAAAEGGHSDIRTFGRGSTDGWSGAGRFMYNFLHQNVFYKALVLSAAMRTAERPSDMGSWLGARHRALAWSVV